MPVDFEKELASLLLEIRKHNAHANTSMVEEAFWLSKAAHEPQKRESGEPYFLHPLAVAKMLAEKGLDTPIITAALLHDTLEDTKLKRDELEKKFGSEIHGLVEGVTKLDIASFRSKQEQSTANIIKTVMASSKDIRVLVIKLFDKLHNMRTIKHLPKEKQVRIAADALTIYVPLAHQLGMHDMKYELEDLCFKVLEPEKYRKFEADVKRSRNEKAKEVREAISALKKKFPEMKWDFEEKKKSIYSIYSKTIAQNKQIKELHDTLILKIITHDKSHCYDALGKVHAAFKPIPKKMKDFIAIPEFFIYQSLHTQVIGPRKKPLKVYIFCREMNETANNGVVALLRPKSENRQLLKEYEKMFSKISSPHIKDGKVLAETLDLDFHNRATIIFTSEGYIINVPIDSTALDFAYFFDDKHAKYSSKAEINGKIRALWTQLSPGDTVKMHYAFTSQFSPAWRGFVHSEKAKRIIEKELSKNIPAKGMMNTVKIELEAADRPGLLAEQSAKIANHGLDMEAINAVCTIDRKACRTEIIIRNADQAKIQKGVSELKEMEETLVIKVDYFQ